MALALGSRRTTIAAIASALAALALAFGVVGRGCGVEGPGPDECVRDLLTAARAGDRKAVFDLLTPDTQKLLAEHAQDATTKVGASTRYDTLDMISIGAFDDPPPPTELKVVEQYGDKATVELDTQGNQGRLPLVKIDGRWRIDLTQYAR